MMDHVSDIRLNIDINLGLAEAQTFIKVFGSTLEPSFQTVMYPKQTADQCGQKPTPSLSTI